MTIAQSLFKLVKDEFARGNKRISKSEIIESDVLYEKNGKKVSANGDTKARKLRLLVEANYLDVEYDHGQAYIVPATGAPKPIEDTDAAEEEPKFYYDIEMRDGRPVAVMKQITPNT